jgi:tRNA(Arg) A34 adenosine deaminase TadA
MALAPTDEVHLAKAIELARRSREKSNHPFGSVLVDQQGNNILEAENTVVTSHDRTGHAELNLVRAASEQFEFEFLQGCTLYASTEPCAMCAGAIYWAGIGAVVYALSRRRLMRSFTTSPRRWLSRAVRSSLAVGARWRSLGRCSRAKPR